MIFNQPALPPGAISGDAVASTAPVPGRLELADWLLAGLLALAALAVFWPATRDGFLNFDDQVYVTANARVQAGVTWANVKWAFTTPVSANWHPLTMLSHMLDCELFGLNPWGHHLVNVLLHGVNAALVFLWLRQATGSRGRSWLAAALFALHPLRVESVAWVAERKDVLCAFFGLLTLMAYTRYAGLAREHDAKAGRFYGLALAGYALGLMCKPMLVTWPLVLLLVDYWPLRRMPQAGFRRPDFPGWLLEKVPFLALAAADSVLTVLFQGQSGVVKTVADYPPGARIGNLLVSYARYLEKTFWPADLAAYYPHPGYWPPVTVLLAAAGLAGITIFCVRLRRHHPYLLMGWLWFLVTLIPVIGLVQVGRQAMADRYTYLPSLGLSLLVVWGMAALAGRWRRHRIILVTLAAAVVACAGRTRSQLAYWRDGETLFRHALAVTRDNYFAHKALGTVLLSQGRTEEAAAQFQAAIALEPKDAEAHNNLGIILLNRGRSAAAAREFEAAVRANPDNAEARYNLANLFLSEGRAEEAIGQFQEVVRLQPENARARNNLGIAFASKGRLDEAVEQFQAALRLKPEDAETRSNLIQALNLLAAPPRRP